MFFGLLVTNQKHLLSPILAQFCSYKQLSLNYIHEKFV